MYSFFWIVLTGGIFAGVGTGLLGVYIIGMRLSFIGVCLSHASLTGAIYAVVFGLDPQYGALAASILTATGLSFLPEEKLHLDNNVFLSLLFSLMLGLTFLGISLLPAGRNELLSLLWGSLLFVNTAAIIKIVLMSLAMILFVWLFNKELKAILFSRTMAKATGVHEKFVYLIFLLIAAVIISVNMQVIGGLLIFGLIVNPAAAAFQLCNSYRSTLITAASLGIASTAGGISISFVLNLPTGACVILFSVLLFAIAALINTIKN